jgi:hypothetical protein
MLHLDRRSVGGCLGAHVVELILVVEVGVYLEGRLRLVVIYTATKGREIWLWLSKVASSSPGDSNAWSLWSRNQMTTTIWWQRTVRKLLLPSVVVTVGGAKMRKDREWRAWIVRQITTIVRFYREQLEVVVVISTLAWRRLVPGNCRLKPGLCVVDRVDRESDMED